MSMMRRDFWMLAFLLLLPACKPRSELLTWELVEAHAHDTDCYTQGLEFHGELLFESGGQYGESKLRRVDPKTGDVLMERKLPAQIFSEGLTVVGDELWLLTWKAGKAYVFDRESFELKHTHTYEGEGWGLAWNGQELIMSNGCGTLTLRDPKDFSIKGEIKVTRDGKPQENLNELEYDDGVMHDRIYANVYQKDEIVQIDPASGEITGVIELSSLRQEFEFDDAQELNGIALHPETGNLWVTGKYWPKMFEIKLKKSR